MPDSDPVEPFEPLGDDIVSFNPAEHVLPYDEGPSHAPFWIAVGIGLVAFVVTLVIPSPLQAFAMAGLEVLPFLPLAVLTNLGRRSDTFRILTLLYWLFLMGLMLLFTVAITAGAFIDMEKLQAASQPGGHPGDAFAPGAVGQILTVGFLSATSLAIGLCCFAPMVRRWAARWLPLDKDSFADATGLATTITLILLCLMPVIVLKGPPLLMMLAKNPQIMKDAAGGGGTMSLMYFYSRLFWTLPVALVAAGYPFHRRLLEAVRRLGVVWPHWWHWLLVPLVTGGLVVLLLGYEEMVINRLWPRMGWPKTDTNQFKEMLKSAFSLEGAIALGIMAGITEELVFRGLFQPRLGIWLTNVLFAGIHALQYNFDALLWVFIIGLVLGYVRKYTNTTTAALIHGLYDFVLVYMAARELEGG